MRFQDDDEDEIWTRIALLGERWQGKLEPHGITYNAAISACERENRAGG